MADMGLRNLLVGYREAEAGQLLKNVVFLELLRRGYEVMTGKIGDREIDFIASKDGKKTCYQVTENLTSETARARVLEPLLQVRDHSEKVILALRTNSTAPAEGIRIQRVIDFLPL